MFVCIEYESIRQLKSTIFVSSPPNLRPFLTALLLIHPAASPAHQPRRAAGAVVGTRLQRHRHRDARICPRGRARARGLHPRFHELGVGCFPEILLDQIAGATLRQPRGQRPRLCRHLLPAAVLRGGGGIRGGEMVMEPLTGFTRNLGNRNYRQGTPNGVQRV